MTLLGNAGLTMEVERLKGEVDRLTARLIEIEGACHAGTASEQMQLGNTISQLRAEVDRLKAENARLRKDTPTADALVWRERANQLETENARLAAVCRLGYETFEWLLPHCDVGKDQMRVALIELNKAGDSTALRDLLEPTVGLLVEAADSVHASLAETGSDQREAYRMGLEQRIRAELARWLAITGDKT